jgi:nucleoside-diphosphate-sugar epimerase
MQTILGSGGVIATELAQQLTQYTTAIRLVSRTPHKVNPHDEVMAADLTRHEQVMQAVHGSEVVYLTAGLEYKLPVWQHDWPLIMANVIDACKASGARLVFFDNVYAYGKVDGWMTESTPYNPCSKKGEVRARIAQQLQDEIQHGDLTALIARSADFYGPHATNTFVLPMVFARLQQGKTANWLGNATLPHSMTFTPDAGKAVAVLGNSDAAFNQVWHLPTDQQSITGEQFIRAVARCLHREPRYSVISRWMLRLAGWFNPLARESMEMLYQMEYPYLFDSSKFASTYFAPTPYPSGIQATVDSLG